MDAINKIRMRVITNTITHYQQCNGQLTLIVIALLAIAMLLAFSANPAHGGDGLTIVAYLPSVAKAFGKVEPTALASSSMTATPPTVTPQPEPAQ